MIRFGMCLFCQAGRLGPPLQLLVVAHVSLQGSNE